MWTGNTGAKFCANQAFVGMHICGKQQQPTQFITNPSMKFTTFTQLNLKPQQKRHKLTDPWLVRTSAQNVLCQTASSKNEVRNFHDYLRLTLFPLGCLMRLERLPLTNGLNHGVTSPRGVPLFTHTLWLHSRDHVLITTDAWEVCGHIYVLLLQRSLSWLDTVAETHDTLGCDQNQKNPIHLHRSQSDS